jgi:membrane-associated phospholipid phosphatase
MPLTSFVADFYAGILIGISRIVDQKHAPWDVLAGWFVGMIIPLITFPRAARMQPYMVADLQPRTWHEKRKRELQKYDV